MAENNNNENLNEVERPTIAELKVRATGIKEETSAGANTAARVGGLMYDMIDVLDANMEQMAGDTLKAPLKAINEANLGNPSNNQFLAYKNNIWTYADLSTVVGSVDWSNITNKPDVVTFDSNGNINIGYHSVIASNADINLIETDEGISFKSFGDATGQIFGGTSSFNNPGLIIRGYDYTEIVTPHLYLNGEEITAGGGGGLTSGSWAKFFDGISKSDTSGYLHVNGNSVSLESGTSGLTSAVTFIKALDGNNQQQGQVPATPAIGPVSLKAGSNVSLSVNSDAINISANCIPYIKVGQTDIPTTRGSHITLKAGSNVTLTPDTTDDSITIAATGGTGGGVAAINVGGQPVAGIGDTFSMTKTNGISLTPYTNGVLIGADFSSVWQPNNSSTPNQVVAGDLNDDVGTEFLNTDGIRSLLSLLRRIAPNMEITAASNDVDKIQFFGIETLTNGSTLANNSYFYLNGTVEGIPNPVIFYNGSIIKLFLYKEDSTYYYCTWNSNKPSGAHSVDPTTSTSRNTFNNILEAVRQGLYANAGISVTFSSDALYTDSDRARSNMPSVRAKVATRA